MFYVFIVDKNVFVIFLINFSFKTTFIMLLVDLPAANHDTLAVSMLKDLVNKFFQIKTFFEWFPFSRTIAFI